MSVNRRHVLRTAAGITVVAAADALAAGCSGAGDHEAGPAATAGTSTPSTSSAGGSTPDAPASGGAGGLPAHLPPEIMQGPGTSNTVALTFHGQGEPPIVRALLREIAAGGASVTVLAVGAWLRAQPELARQVLDGGHELGNHTDNHLAIARLSPQRAFAEINGCAVELKRLTGSIGTWFRPSQTQFSTPTIRAEATKVGYRTVLSYDLDSLDYTNPSGPSVTNTVLARVHPGSIVSMHFGYPSTVAAMPALLDGLRRKGLKAVTMTQLLS
jgi:peptidoglycan/xylan/chitin deacetylase (PgdA/CDA1 family)